MTTPIAVNIPHQLGRVEARRRIETGFAEIVHLLPGGAGECDEHWDGDRLVFRVAAMGQSVTGTIDVLDTAIAMELELPGLLGLLAGSIQGRMQKVGQKLLAGK